MAGGYWAGTQGSSNHLLWSLSLSEEGEEEEEEEEEEECVLAGHCGVSGRAVGCVCACVRVFASAEEIE